MEQGNLTGRPERTRRDVVYELLRDAGPAGITHRELAEQSCVPRSMVHVESLIFEGHGIEQLKGTDARGLPVTLLRLVKDAWALEPDARERCGGSGRVLLPPDNPIWKVGWGDKPCPGCPDCESRETEATREAV